MAFINVNNSRYSPYIIKPHIRNYIISCVVIIRIYKGHQYSKVLAVIFCINDNTRISHFASSSRRRSEFKITKKYRFFKTREHVEQTPFRPAAISRRFRFELARHYTNLLAGS